MTTERPTALPAGGALVRILLACPHCGAPFSVDDETRSLLCEHCDSRLLLEAPEREEIYVVDGQVKQPAELLEILIEYRVQAQRAEIVHRHRDSEGNPPSELFIERQLRAYEKKLRGQARLVATRPLHVPYWHLTGAIVQGLLARRKDTKITHVRAFALEHTVPGYPTLKANLRDKGLRMDRALARPLSAALVKERGSFLPWVELPEQQSREIDKWLQRDLDPEVEPMFKHGELLFARRLLIYRPYWLAKAMTDKGQEWLLFDGCFRTIAGYPTEPEARALGALRDPDPLRAASAPYRRVLVVPSRCPDCGAESRFEPTAVVSVCPNCNLGLELTATGARVVPYDHGAGGRLDAEYLPFWRYEIEVRFAGGRSAGTLEDYVHALLPQKTPAFAVKGPHLYLPALRLLGTPPGDAAWKALVEWVHAETPEIVGGKIPLGGRARPWAASVTEEDARATARFALFALFSKSGAARLNAIAARRALKEAKLELRVPRLVLLPFERSGEELLAREGGPRVAQFLLRPSAELRQMRATVQGAFAAAPH